MRRRAGAVAFAVSTLLFASCGGDGDDNGTGPSPAITLAVTPTTVSVQAGATATLNVSIERSGGFSGAVTVAVENLPAGVTAGALAIAAGATSGSITLTAAASAAVGNATLTVRATGTGVEARTATVLLTVTAAPTPSITLAVAPATLSLQQGQSGTATLTITRSNFTGAVSVTSAGAPQGITVTFNPTSVTGTTSSITAAVALSVPPGTYPVSVQTTGVGIAPANAPLTITVTGPPAFIAINAAPQSLTIQQGQSGTSQLTITRTNFTGAVNLTSTGVPAGVTVTFSPSSTTGSTASVTVAVSATLVAGSYSMTVQAAGTGVASVSVVLGITVTVPGATGNVTWTFCAQSGLPLWFAFSDNGGAWMRLTSATGVYNFTVGQRGRVAWVMQDGAKTRLELFYGSLQELNGRGTSFCRGNGSVKTINGTVSGLTASQRALISMGAGFATVLGGAGSTFQLTNVQDGLLDLLGVRQNVGVPTVTNSIVIQRDRNDANGASVAVDFNTGVAAITRTATIANLGADNAIMSASFLSRSGTVALLSADAPGTATTRTFSAVPDGSVISGDWHLQSVSATPPSSTTGLPLRSVLEFKQFGTDRTLTLPNHITTPPSVSVASVVPYVTLTTQWVVQSAAYNEFWVLTMTPASGNVSSVILSGGSGYFGSGPVRLDVPAFDATFNPQHSLQQGIPVSFTFFAAGGTAFGGPAGHAALPNEGAIATTAAIQGVTFTP